MSGPPLLKLEPFKTLYASSDFILTVFLRVPVWILLAILPSQRPRRSWTVKRCVLLKLTMHFMRISSRVGGFGRTFNHLVLGEGKGVKGVWVPSTPDLVVGKVKELAEVAGVEAMMIPGYWMDKKGGSIPVGQAPAESEKVIYALHGGGYVVLSAHPSDPTANIAHGLLEYCKEIKRVFSLEYRLSVGKPRVPANPFPAALIDAIAGYNYLVNIVGFAPENIIIEGDSAGGNLALTLTRYLIDYPNPSLPLPGALLLLSPWCDLGRSHVKEGSSLMTMSCDYLPVWSLNTYPTSIFLGPNLDPSHAEENPYISPASLSAPDGIFKGFPRTFIVSGDAERLLDQIRTLYRKMAEDLDENAVTYHEAKDAVHDFIVIPWHDPERREALQKIAQWVSQS